MAIHEDAIEELREANPGLELLRNVSVLDKRVDASARGLAERGIPVRDTHWDRRHPPEGETTRLAQIYWASRLIDHDEEDEE